MDIWYFLNISLGGHSPDKCVKHQTVSYTNQICQTPDKVSFTRQTVIHQTSGTTTWKDNHLWKKTRRYKIENTPHTTNIQFQQSYRRLQPTTLTAIGQIVLARYVISQTSGKFANANHQTDGVSRSQLSVPKVFPSQVWDCPRSAPAKFGSARGLHQPSLTCPRSAPAKFGLLDVCTSQVLLARGLHQPSLAFRRFDPAVFTHQTNRGFPRQNC